jgi:hypothetical protein
LENSWPGIRLEVRGPACVLLLAKFFIVADVGNLQAHLAVLPVSLRSDASDVSVKCLASALEEIGRPPTDKPVFSKLGAINVILVYLGIIAANLLLVGTLVAAALVLVGIIRIDIALTRHLAGGPPHVLLHLPVGNMVVTQELLSLSLTLGGLAVLSFAVINLPSRQARAEFVAVATSGLRRVLYAYSVYQTALDNEAALTGVNSRNRSQGSPP